MTKRRHDAASVVWSGDLRGIVAIAATYVYFLLFAQYGLLALLEARLPSVSRRPVMAAMGIAGLAASLAAAWLLRRDRRGRALVVVAFAGAVLAALGALGARTLSTFVPVAAAVGLAVGALTVGLSSELGRWVRDPARGMKVAIGTGVAYLTVNVPWLFSGPPERQAIAAAVAAGVGVVAIAMPERPAGSRRLLNSASPQRWLIQADDARGRGLAAIVLVFVALIALDSAAFAIIQHAAALKAPTWGSGAQSLRMGVFHLAGALGAGVVLDRGRFFPLLVGVYALFATGLGLLASGIGSGAASGALYAAGIGAYSVALVLYPSGGAEGPGLVPRWWRAAAVYGVGGWLGSALGVALAERHQRIPIALVWLAGALVAAGALLRRRRLAAPVVESFGLALLCAAVAIWIHGVTTVSAATTAPRDRPDSVARGRAIYIAEGCQHCHSQYVRATGADRGLWGPLRAGAGAGDPPLYGVRRQGPDLANVGNRRSEAWQRLHLIDPRSVSPASRMPSYAHLFATPGGHGDDLIAYLESLGAATGPERFRDLQAQPIEVDAAAPPDQGRALFALYCARCHGGSGRGDGPLAPLFDRKPGLDLGRGAFALVSFGAGIGTFDEGLARVIRFGVPGTSMPGHEHLDDGEVSALVGTVRALGGGPGPEALACDPAAASPRPVRAEPSRLATDRDRQVPAG